MKNTKTKFLIWKIIVGIADAYSIFQIILTNKEEMFSIEINNTWLSIFCFLTILFVGIFLYEKISYKFNLLNSKLLALKKFRDEESLDIQKYILGLTKVMKIQIKNIYLNILKQEWKEGEKDELFSIQDNAIQEKLKEAIEEYNKVFSECKTYKQIE